MVVEEPTVKGTLVEGFTHKKALVEGSVAENTVNKKMGVDSLSVKLFLDRKDLKTYCKLHFQLVHCFSISVIAVLVLKH